MLCYVMLCYVRGICILFCQKMHDSIETKPQFQLLTTGDAYILDMSFDTSRIDLHGYVPGFGRIQYGVPKSRKGVNAEHTYYYPPILCLEFLHAIVRLSVSIRSQHVCLQREYMGFCTPVTWRSLFTLTEVTD